MLNIYTSTCSVIYRLLIIAICNLSVKIKGSKCRSCYSIKCTRYRMAIILIDKYTTGLSWYCMMTSSNGNNFRVTGPLCGEFTRHRWISLTEASDAELWCFNWSSPWINGWVNNGEAGDLRRHRAHYDVIVMNICTAYLQHYWKVFIDMQGICIYITSIGAPYRLTET